MDGLLLVDKPSGWTSFDVVAKVRSTLRSHQPSLTSLQGTKDGRLTTPSRKVKVGHTGTLDPLATGLLVLCLGSYCKRAQEFSKLDKVYEVTMTLGKVSSTGDAEGELSVPAYSKYSTLSHKIFTKLTDRVPAVFEQFTGEIKQTPPAYSAVKINGQRAYKLARAGKDVVLEPRKVKVYSLQLTHYKYPEVKFTTKVSSGTYIRSLVEDIGKELEVGAYMSALRRTHIGDFDIEQAIAIEGLSIEQINSHIRVA